MLMFHMDVKTALKFYEQCIKEGVKDEKGRIEILIRMTKDNQIAISKTNRTKEQVIKDLQLHYKSLLSIEPKQEDK